MQGSSRTYFKVFVEPGRPIMNTTTANFGNALALYKEGLISKKRLRLIRKQWEAERRKAQHEQKTTAQDQDGG
jgi:hypothetical protein